MQNKLALNRDYYTVVANDIIKGKQSMSLQTARLVRLLITQVVKEDKDLKTYKCKISELANFLNISRTNLYTDVFKLCDDLTASRVYISTGNPKHPWKIFHWVSMAEYDGNGTLILRLSDEIKPYVLELEKWFTQYQLKNILEFKSYYAIRLYEIIKCEDGLKGGYSTELKFSISDLRIYFDCEDKHKKISDFKKYVIETAVKEINEKSDLLLVPKYEKNGRSITNIVFEIHSNITNLSRKADTE